MKTIQPVILRYHPGDKETGSKPEAVLFIPDMAANPGFIMSYVPVGQHGEACMEYFRDTKPIYRAPKRYFDLGEALLAEYRGICESAGETMKGVKRDTAKFRAARWRI